MPLLWAKKREYNVHNAENSAAALRSQQILHAATPVKYHDRRKQRVEGKLFKKFIKFKIY